MREGRKLIGRVVNAIRMAIVRRVDDSKQIQELQTEALEDEVDDAVPHYQPLGLSFRPEADAEAILFSVGSDVANRIALAVQARGARPTDAEEGCGGMFRPLDGTWAIYVAADGTLHLAERDAGDWVALASLVLAELNDIREKFDAHIHTTTATVGASATPGVIAPPSPAMGPASSVASENVKCP
jgi:phage baseplate assembly protein V